MSSKQNANASAEAIIKRVSRKHDEEGHSGAWKVAFADFCLALMCLFLVLWVLAAREQERVEATLQAAGGDLLNEGQGRRIETMGGPRGSLIDRHPLPPGEGRASDPGEGPILTRKRYESAADLQEVAKVLARLSEQAGLAGNLQTVITPYGLRVMLHDTDKQGMFERGSALINERFRQLLHRMGPIFAQIENQLLIVGHTDSLQYAGRNATAFSNWGLSSQRAMAARAHLLDGGMPTDSILQVVGMADRAPIDVDNPRAGVNRRIEMLVLTSSQSRAVAAMFGMPGQVATLMEGVDSTLTDSAMLNQLRARVHPEKVSMKLPTEPRGK